ncbi:S-layer homology domain-containing protein [Paenibacillus sp. FSL L8-0323]|uniref:S-layer homology domain-containing protein n=1 Tax=Paenibacillus sp. FSL L8-0323 TaxID=2975330 RepID=UPI0030FB0A38
MKKNKFLAWLLIVAVFITTFSTSVIPAQANGASSTLKGYVTVSVEKFTVGQGYIKEPIKVPIYEGDNGASLITRALGDGNYRYLGNIDSGFYLSEVKDSGRSEVNIPQYILDMISADGNTVGTKADPEWLSQFDYTSMSGWMYAVNNVFPPFGMTDYKPQDGDIIRTQFTTYGYGSDLGGWGEIPVQLANKDALTAEIAEINSDPNKETILDRPVVQSAVYQAYSVLENMASSQISVDHALVGLNHALDIEPPVITVSGIQDKQEVSNKDISFKVAVTDNVYSDIIPEVKLNGVTLSPANGEYKASLNSGSNAITVTALDGAGNKTNVTYQVTYKLETTVAVKQQLDKSLAYILNTVKNPSFGTGSGEWSILSLARANYTVPNGYYDLYYNNVATKIASIIKEDGKLDANKSTENSRAILGLTSIGKDITNVAGYDLRKALADYQYIQKQGNNGPIFALIALDSHNYEIPVVEGITEQTTREKLVQYILDKEVKKGTAEAGGWALGVTKADVDMTAMAMQALAPYYATRDDVKAAVDRAIQWLSDNQNNQGGFTSWGSTSSESISQVIVALTGVGVDPHTDARFVKSGNSLIDALLSFAAPEGGFKHILTGKVDNMATDQGTYALVSYDRLINHSSRLFDMNDVQLEQPTTVVAKQQLNKSLAYILNTVKNPSFGTGSGEWSILSLARANYTVPNGYYDLYYNNVATKIASIIKEDGKLDANKSTENSRAILGLTSIGKDITNVAGYDLRKALADYQYIQKQGNNGPIFALIALDSHNYEIPVVDGVTEQTTREKLVQYILDKEVKKGTAEAGGWALGVTKADVDMTAMAMQALAPYYATRDDVKAAVDRAIQWLSDNQNNQGGFTSWGSTSSESISQVIVALTGVGVDPHTDARFVKSGNSLIDALLSFAAPEGGFKHILTGKVDNMATDQGTYALVSYDRLINHSSRLFDMNDVKVEQPEEPGPGQPEGPKEFPLPSGENPKVEIPNDANDYIVPINTGDSNKEITVAIPEGNQSKVSVNLPSNSDLPQIEAIKGNVSVVIPKGAKVTSGDASAIELISALTGGESALKDSVNQIIPGDKKLDNILQTFSMGGSARVEFSQFITLTFKDLKGKDAAYIQNGTPHAIQKFASDDLGFASGKSEYAYDSGNDLIVKTNHFTDYIAYASSAVQTPGGDGGNGNGEGNGSGNGEGNGGNNGGGTTPSKPYVILSVDKLTINKGYVVPSVQVELQSGDTVWSVLKRVLDSRGIDYRDSWNSDFGSVYVESIAGDGEFDHGSGSGWMYNVNGKYPNYGASSYDLSAGDRIQWRYTTNLGVDLNAPIPTMSPTPTPKPGATPAPGGGANPEGSGDPNVSPSPTVTPKDPTQNTNDIKQLYTDADKISSWAYSAIETATVKGYIQGNNGQVNPKAYITRAEFTKILVSALELDIKSDKGITYKDVALGDWFYPYVNAAHKAGLITGFNNEFKPNDKITREQMAAIIVRALAIPATKPGTAIKDINTVSAWAKADVETVVATGLMLGDDNQFKPKELVTREMAAVVATRTHDYKSGNKVVSPTIQNSAVSSYIQNTAAFLQKTVTNPVISSVGGDWTVFGLARSGVKVPDSYYTKYYANVEATLKEKSGKLHSVKYTEYDRVILALTSINKNIDKVAGYNLLEPLADFDTVIKQGINGPVFALIALDSNHYEIPVVKDVKTQTTREMLINYILGREISGGGWALGSNATAADPDITGMVIQGLTPYYKSNAKVTAAVDRGIAWLSKTQTADGGFASWESTNSESIAQVIVALTGLGIDPHKDSRFIKNGHSAVDALISFAAPEGGFYHVKQGGVGNGGAQPGEVDLMATDQAMYALVSYDRLVNGQTRLYDMTDVK